MSIREIRGPESAFGSAFRSHPTHPTWGADLSGSLQGARGLGGLLMCVANPKHRVLWVPDGMLPSMAYYFLYDGNGNVSETIHERGAVLGQYRYDGFGKLMGQNATHYVTTDANGIDQIYSGINQPFKFSTKWHDDTNHNSASYGPYCRSRSLVYYGYRTYSPDMGRWLGRDPIEEEGGLNLFGMVGNDSLNDIDPVGLSSGSGGGPTAWYRTCAVAKSFINGLPSVGTFLELPPTLHPGIVDRNRGGAANLPGGNVRLSAAAAIWSLLPAFNQDPTSDAKDGEYRLFRLIAKKFGDSSGNGGEIRHFSG